MHMIIIGLMYVGLLTDLPITIRDAETRRTIRGATVRNVTSGAITDFRGVALLRECTDTVVVRTTMAGYDPRVDTVVIGSIGDTLTLYLEPRSFDAAQITVTGARTAQPRDESPILVSLTDRDALRAVQALSMAEGLSFQPGLRLENNCQNCGFTQVRLNGLQGPYTQILIDSRPVFSSLAGVYGLEHIPIEMIDRIEVVRGAGSALYGAGAVAGTVNVIPRDPTTTSLSASSTGSWLNGRTPDAMTSLRGTWASADLSTGVSVFGVTRSRSAYDHNGDTYSEVPLTRTTSGGMRAVHEFSERDRLTLDAHWIREFRRGGNLFDRPPYEADIAEQIDHAIAGGAVSYEHAFDDRASRLHLYVSARSTGRASYYGGTGGDPAMASEAARFFGTTDDEIGVAGVQVTTRSWSIGTIPLLVIGGVEVQHADVDDAMPGYARRIEQRINDVGSYAQVQIAPGSSISVALGLRADALRIDGRYRFDSLSSESVNTSFFVLNPRISVIGRINDDWQLRTTYASGFRGPQAFDEDLHISTLQGAARLIRLDPSLRPELSHSITLSMDGTMATPTTALGITADLFATMLTSPFVTALTSDSLPGSNASIARKTNGDASYVAGTNLELRYALARTFELTTSLTLQLARYTTAQVMAESDQGAVVTTQSILRTPDVYASAIATWTPTSALTFDASCVLTGPMWVVNERLIERIRTPWFADLGIQGTYATRLGNVGVTLGLGIVNILNAYQRDLERGSQRDAAYFYGPLRPRTVSCSMGVTWQ
jgi:outer membrane receptor for ferrienterochelin and colicins